ncbi:MAG TPA: hypothetical protein DDZ80_31015 [Cyanobacteria bacterium UBA8803]|nr:hypothetical protein [Cyanobacteria bacterium UBA9273]HBL62652.1 hypothetical protein [Cyanobacteria bacterium UBA8803]
MEFKISVSFRLAGIDFNPEEITALVGIIPSKTWKIGDLIDPRSSIRRKCNGWSLESKLDKSTNLDEQIKSVFEQLQPGWQSLVEICARHDALIDCAIYVYKQVPAIHFDKDIVRKATELNAEIDVDLYFLPDD